MLFCECFATILRVFTCFTSERERNGKARGRSRQRLQRGLGRRLLTRPGACESGGRAGTRVIGARPWSRMARRVLERCAALARCTEQQDGGLTRVTESGVPHARARRRERARGRLDVRRWHGAGCGRDGQRRGPAARHAPGAPVPHARVASGYSARRRALRWRARRGRCDRGARGAAGAGCSAPRAQR